MPILIRPAAAADIDEAYLWYERRQAGLGDEFLTAVHSALDQVVAHPTRYPVVYRETRRVLVHRFPYLVFYRVYDETVVVVACMHGRGNPRRWRSRT
jgi:plasmid stabilization system protein ParE